MLIMVHKNSAGPAKTNLDLISSFQKGGLKPPGSAVPVWGGGLYLYIDV